MSTEEHLYYLLTNSHQSDLATTGFIHPPTISALERTRAFSVNYLAELTPRIFKDALEDLRTILKLGETLLFDSKEKKVSLEIEAKDMAYDDFRTLQFVFENHIDLAEQLELKTDLSIYQFYSLLALWNYANAYKGIDKTSLHVKSPAIYYKLCLDAVSLAMSANMIVNHVYESVLGSVALERINTLEHLSLRQSEGGKKGALQRYGNETDRKKKKQELTQRIVTESLKVRENHPLLSAEQIKKKVATNFGISKGTINNHLPKFATQLKKSFQ